MEACPKLPMLAFDHKISPDNANFSMRLKALIHEHYQENPNKYATEISEMEQLRANACIRPTLDMGGVANIQKYYCQLHFLENRFKITDGQFDLPWYDVCLGIVCNYTDLTYEKAATLYNYGAVHAVLGAQDPRASSEGMEVACTHFQCAAWAFHTVPDRYPTQVGSDMSTDLLAFLAQVCLAQAQECILEKSILDNRKSAIIAKVCAQVVEYYKAALKKIESSNTKNDDEPISECVGEKRSKAWTRYVEFKMTYYTSLSYLFMGYQSEESQKMGERVAYFKAASESLEKAGKLTKGLDVIDKGLIANCLTFASGVINGKYENSKKENEFVYHEKVPDVESLPELKGASLVKGLGFEITDPEVSGPDIFNRIVPMEAHEAASLYSEEKAKILRQIGNEIEMKDSELAVFMSSLQLEDVPNPGDDIGLPVGLIEVVAAFSVKNNDQNAIQKLTEAMGRIASISSDVEASINEIDAILGNEKDEEASFEAIMGTRPTPLSTELTLELNKFRDAHKMASESNQTLHSAIQSRMKHLQLLQRPLEDIQKEIPSMVDLDQESEENIAEVRKILAKVDEMRAQREKLLESLRSQLHSDDITGKLMISKPEDAEDVFEKELKKYDGQIKVIRQNLLAQKIILSALTEINANYASTRKVVGSIKDARRNLIDGLMDANQAYKDLLLKAAEGLQFYDKLDSNVRKLLSRVKGVVKVQQEERDARIVGRNPMGYPNHPHQMSMPGGYPPASAPSAPSFSSGKPTLLEAMKARGMMTGPNVAPNAPKADGNPERLTLKQVMEQRKDLHGLGGSPQKQNPQAPGSYPTASYPGYSGYPPQSQAGVSPAYQQYPAAPPTSAVSSQSYYTPYGMPSSTAGGGSQGLSVVSSTPPTSVMASMSQVPSGAYHYPSGPGGPSPLMSVSSAYPVSSAMVSQMATSGTYAMVGSSHHVIVNPQALGHTPGGIPGAPAPQPLAGHQYPSSYIPPNPSMSQSSPTPSLVGGVPPSSTFPNQPTRQVHPTFYPNPSGYSHPNPAYPTGSGGSVVPAVAHYAPYQYPASSHSTTLAPSGRPNYVPSTQGYAPQQTQHIHQGMPRPPQPGPSMVPHRNQYQGQLPQNNSQPQQINPQPNGQHQEQLHQHHQHPQHQYQLAQQPPTHPAYPSPQQQSYQVGQQQQYLHQHQHPQRRPQQTPQQDLTLPPQQHLNQPPQQQLQQHLNQPPQQQLQQHLNQPPQQHPNQNPQHPNHNPQQHPNQNPQQHPNQNPQQLQHNPEQPPNQNPQQHPNQNSQQHLKQHPQQHPNQNQQQLQHNPHQPPNQNQQQQQYQQYQQQQSQQLQYQQQQNSYPQLYQSPGQSSPSHQTLSTVASSSSPDVRDGSEPRVGSYPTYPGQQTPTSGALYTGGVSTPEPTAQSQVGSTPPSTLNSPQVSQVGQQYPQVPVPMSSYPVPPVSADRRSSNGTAQSGTAYPPNGGANSPTVVAHPSSTAKPMILHPVVPMPTGEPVGEIVPRQTSVDILSELDKPGSFNPPDVLQPKVMTAHDLEEQKKEAQASQEIAKAKQLDPYEEPASQMKLLAEYNVLKSTLESMAQDKTTLDQLWRDMNGKLHEEPQYGTAIAVARCYPVKNRFHDVLPFDQTRVELPTTKDDYINASHIKDLSTHSPKFIATQAPAKNTLTDFWTMVWQENVETMVCLLSQADLADIYWPQERKESLKVAQLEITLQSVKAESKKTERIFTVLNRATNTSRVIIHSMLCDYALDGLVQLVKDTLNYHGQQRVLAHPILVHCLGGSGRTAQFLALSAALAEIKVGLEGPTLIPDLAFITAQICKQRKGVLKEKDHLKQVYQGVALFCRDILVKHGLAKPDPKKEPKRDFPDAPPLKPSEELERSLSTLDLNSPTDMNKLADMDPNGTTSSKTGKKMSKQDFLHPKTGHQDEVLDLNDPLSQLDAFWNLKK